MIASEGERDEGVSLGQQCGVDGRVGEGERVQVVEVQ